MLQSCHCHRKYRGARQINCRESDLTVSGQHPQLQSFPAKQWGSLLGWHSALALQGNSNNKPAWSSPYFYSQHQIIFQISVKRYSAKVKISIGLNPIHLISLTGPILLPYKKISRSHPPGSEVCQMELQSWEQSLFLATSSFFASTLKGIKDTSWSVAAQTQQEKDSWMSSMGAPHLPASRKEESGVKTLTTNEQPSEGTETSDGLSSQLTKLKESRSQSESWEHLVSYSLNTLPPAQGATVREKQQQGWQNPPNKTIAGCIMLTGEWGWGASRGVQDLHWPGAVLIAKDWIMKQ